MMLEAGDFVLVLAMHELINENSDALPGGMAIMPIEVDEGYFRVGSEGSPVELRMRIAHRSFRTTAGRMAGIPTNGWRDETR